MISYHFALSVHVDDSNPELRNNYKVCAIKKRKLLINYVRMETKIGDKSISH